MCFTHSTMLCEPGDSGSVHVVIQATCKASWSKVPLSWSNFLKAYSRVYHDLQRSMISDLHYYMSRLPLHSPLAPLTPFPSSLGGLQSWPPRTSLSSTPLHFPDHKTLISHNDLLPLSSCALFKFFVFTHLLRSAVLVHSFELLFSQVLFFWILICILCCLTQPLCSPKYSVYTVHVRVYVAYKPISCRFDLCSAFTLSPRLSFGLYIKVLPALMSWSVVWCLCSMTP